VSTGADPARLALRAAADSTENAPGRWHEHAIRTAARSHRRRADRIDGSRLARRIEAGCARLHREQSLLACAVEPHASMRCGAVAGSQVSASTSVSSVGSLGISGSTRPAAGEPRSATRDALVRRGTPAFETLRVERGERR
jgi:hypothetical protein